MPPHTSSILILCCALILFTCTVYATSFSQQRPPTNLTAPIDADLVHPWTHQVCANIELHKDQCTFVQSACHGFSGLYLRFYYCTTLWKPIAVAALCSALLLLFGAVSVVASDFFCPNLQTISAKLQLSESMAGVTVLAFGNGSPDLFSTFSAMDSGSGSLAIGELIGACFFITAIVAGSMGIIRPFQSKRITFMRDATFLTGAIMMITWIVYHQCIYWYHGIALIAYYLIYVLVVMLGACNFQGNNAPTSKMEEQRSVAEELIDETTRLLGGGSSRQQQSKPPRLSIPIHGFATAGGAVEHHLGHIIRPMTARSLSRHSLRIDTHSTGFPRTTSTNGSISSRLVRQPMTPRVGIRTSLFGAIEFQQHVKAMRRATSSNQFPASPSTTTTTTNNHLRRRQISMPHWGKQNNTGGMSSTSVAATTATPGVHVSYGARSATTGRPRASTVNDHLLTTQRPNNNHHSNSGPMSPDSTGSSTGLAEDYFAYLSANQHNQCPMMELPEQQVCRSGTDLTIPEIRLAPPNNNAMHLSSSPNEPRRLRRGSTSLHVPPSPSIANTEDDIYVSARQSPAVSPSPSMYYVPHHHSPDHRSISIVLSHVDNQGDLPFVQRALEPHFALPESRASCTTCFTACCPQLMDSVRQALFPTMQDWCEKSWFSKLSTLIAVPLVLVFTLTLPVAEQEGGVQVDDFQMLDEDEDNDPAKHLYLSVATDDGYSDIMADDPLMQDEFQQQQQQPWCRWLLALQAVCGTTFLAVIMAINEFIAPVHIVFGFAAGCMLAGLVFIGTDADKPPKWSWMLSFAGFFVALNWIFFLANNMVGLLKALGMIFDISEAIMGLTVFALGNSIGDFVANTAIAKMGFPTMAISACYAGPLLNMVLGVGVSSSYQIFKTGKPYQLDIAPTILVSAAGLIMVLLSTLVVVNLNGYYINKRLGIWMIAIYMICCIINVTLEWGIAL